MKILMLPTTASLALLAGLAVASAQTTTTTTVTKETTTTGATGGATIVLSPAQRTEVHKYIVEHKRPSVRVQEKVTVGSTLPPDVDLYTIEGAPTITKYRYTVVNGEPVLVDPGTRRVIEVLD